MRSAYKKDLNVLKFLSYYKDLRNYEISFTTIQSLKFKKYVLIFITIWNNSLLKSSAKNTFIYFIYLFLLSLYTLLFFIHGI